MLPNPIDMQPRYQLQVAQGALENLHSLPSDDQMRVESILDEVSKNEKPTDHPKVKVLNNNQPEKLYKIRIGNYRAIARLESPVLQILKFDKRKHVYQNINQLYESL
jgi:mRNA-degrading endonuclease RelE of RelBE toxin-antitoxin system